MRSKTFLILFPLTSFHILRACLRCTKQLYSYWDFSGKIGFIFISSSSEILICAKLSRHGQGEEKFKFAEQNSDRRYSTLTIKFAGGYVNDRRYVKKKRETENYLQKPSMHTPNFF